MSKEYVILNKSKAIAGLRRHDSLGTKIRLLPENRKGEGKWYEDIGVLEESDINYYNSLRKLGLHLMDKEKFNDLYDEDLDFESDEEDEEISLNEDNEEEIEETDEEENIEKDSVDNEESDNKEVEEETNEDEESVNNEEIEEGEEDSNTSEEYSKENLEDKTLEELRDVAKDLEIEYYWSKNKETLVEEILEEELE